MQPEKPRPLFPEIPFWSKRRKKVKQLQADPDHLKNGRESVWGGMIWL